jgi:hypothetical protein
MADIDDDIDRLYQGPLDGFIDARNALAKAARRPDLKKLEKPGVAAWAVNQLHWHHRAVIDRIVSTAAAVRDQHHRALQGEKADVHAAEQAHGNALRGALADVRALLAEGGHPATPATLEAVRETLRALPAPEANGRLVRPLAPKGLEALAGLVLSPRPAAPAGLRLVAAPPEALPETDTGDTGRPRAAERDAAQAQAREAEARAERERQVRRQAAEAALTEARARLRLAEAAVADAERALSDRLAERDAASEACEHAKRVAGE